LLANRPQQMVSRPHTSGQSSRPGHLHLFLIGAISETTRPATFITRVYITRSRGLPSRYLVCAARDLSVTLATVFQGSDARVELCRSPTSRRNTTSPSAII